MFRVCWDIGFRWVSECIDNMFSLSIKMIGILIS